MKLVVSAIIVLSSAAALATPAVGDYVKYGVQVTQGTQSVSGTLERELTAYDQASQAYAEKTTTTVDGQQPQVGEQAVGASDLINDAGIQQILTNCAAYGGALSSVTVPAGTFNICAVPVDNDSEHSVYGVAQVPYGFVAADVTSKTSGAHTVAQLEAYRTGAAK